LHLRKHRKIKAKSTFKDQSDYFFPAQQNNTAQWKKDESCKSTSQLFWDKSYVNTAGTINMWDYAVDDWVTILAVYKTMYENAKKIALNDDTCRKGHLWCQLC